jgi:hypothetical protein
MTFIITSGSSIAPATASGSLFLTIQILPLASTSPYSEQYPRLTLINGAVETEIGLISFRYGEATEAGGRTGSFVVHKFSDRSLVDKDTLIRFERVTRAGALIETIFENASISEDSIQIAADSFTFSVISNASDKLNTCLDEALIIRDADRVPFDIEDVEKEYDVSGNEYETEDQAITDLTRNDMLEEILVNRCGFDSYVIDIEDDPVKQATFEAGVPLIEGIKSKLGVFRPLLTEANNILTIRDRTALKAEGFPTPPDLTLTNRVIDYSIRNAYTQANWAEILYSESGEYDGYYQTFTNKQYDNGGDSGDGTLITTTLLEIYANFYSNAVPGVVQQKLLVGSNKSTYNGTLSPGNLSREDIFESSFDAYGRITRSTNSVNELVPDPDNEGDFIWKENTSVTTSFADFGQHPTKLKKQFPKSIKTIETGLAYVDTDNPYAWNNTADEAVQYWRDAHRAMNVKAGMTFREDQVIKTNVELFQPDRNGLVQYSRSGVDHLRNTIIGNKNDQRAGDISVNGALGRTQKIRVAETDDTVITGQKITVPIGELPLEKGINLARRVLTKLKTKNKSLSLTLDGIDSFIKRGYEFSISDKDFDIQGSFLCVSFECAGEVDQTSGAVSYTTTLEAEQI